MNIYLCAVCGREMEVGDTAYDDGSGELICENCFDIQQEREKKDAERTIDSSDCEDANAGCFSHSW